MLSYHVVPKKLVKSGVEILYPLFGGVEVQFEADTVNVL